MMEIDNKYITEVENIIWDFIWEERRCFVKPDVCMLPRHKGGLGIPGFKALVQVRRIKMVIDLLKQQGPWCTLALGHLQCVWMTDTVFRILPFRLMIMIKKLTKQVYQNFINNVFMPSRNYAGKER